MSEDVEKETATRAAEVAGLIEKGEITLNQARTQFGLKPIDEPQADKFLKVSE